MYMKGHTGPPTTSTVQLARITTVPRPEMLSELNTFVRCPSVPCDYVLLPLVNKEPVLVYYRTEYNQMGNPSRDRERKTVGQESDQQATHRRNRMPKHCRAVIQPSPDKQNLKTFIANATRRNNSVSSWLCNRTQTLKRRNYLVFKSRKTGTPAVSPNAVRPNAQVHLGHSQVLITRAVLTSCCGHFFMPVPEEQFTKDEGQMNCLIVQSILFSLFFRISPKFRKH